MSRLTSTPTPAFTFAGRYLPGLSTALTAVQDADTMLLGVPDAPGFKGRISGVIAAHRTAARPLAVWVQGGDR